MYSVLEQLHLMDYDFMVCGIEGPTTIELPQKTYWRLLMEMPIATINTYDYTNYPKEMKLALPSGYLIVKEAI